MKSWAFDKERSLWKQIALKCECVTTLWPPGVCVCVLLKVKGQILVATTPAIRGRGYLHIQMNTTGHLCVWGTAVPSFGADRANEDPWTGKMRTSSRRLHKNISLSPPTQRNITAGLLRSTLTAFNQFGVPNPLSCRFDARRSVWSWNQTKISGGETFFYLLAERAADTFSLIVLATWDYSHFPH